MGFVPSSLRSPLGWPDTVAAALGSAAALVRLGRPLFLGGGFMLYGSARRSRRAQGHAIELRGYLLGQPAVTAFQLMTHYANDYFDYEADRANRTPTRWSGGSRVLPGGELPRMVALIAALVLAALGLGVTGRCWPRAAAGPLRWSPALLAMCAARLGVQRPAAAPVLDAASASWTPPWW